MKKEIIFRARRKDNGEWVEGNYHHNIRKGEIGFQRTGNSQKSKCHSSENTELKVENEVVIFLCWPPNLKSILLVS